MFLKICFGTFLVTNSNKMSKKSSEKYFYTTALLYIVLKLYF